MKGLGHEFINEDKLLTEEQVSYDDGGDLWPMLFIFQRKIKSCCSHSSYISN